MNDNEIWRQILQFIQEERWYGEYTRETELVKDLKLKGDDAYEFICLFGKRFNVNVTDFDFYTYFESEGDCILPMIINLILNRKKKVKKKLTLKDLERSIRNGKLV